MNLLRFARVLRHADKRLGAVLVALILAVTTAQPLFAHGFSAGDIRIDHPWLRMTPPGAKVAGGYVIAFVNQGKEADQLVSATVEVADRTEIHEMAVQNGIMTMRPLADGVALAPGEKTEFAPGGLHLMLFGLKHPLKEGETYKGSLTFAKAGTVNVEFKVEGMAGPKGASAAPEGHDAHGNHGAHGNQGAPAH